MEKEVKTVTVHSKAELKTALAAKVDEIIVADAELTKQLKALRMARNAGPVAIGALIAAIPLIPFTGGTSIPIAVGFVGGGAGAAIAGLAVAIGGALLIGILTDWEEVELNGLVKLKRRNSGKTPKGT